MEDSLRDDLKCKEIPSKPQEKVPYHHHIWYFAYFYGYGHQYLTYLPWKFLSKLFFGKSMARKYPTYLQCGYMSKTFVFFLGPFPKRENTLKRCNNYCQSCTIQIKVKVINLITWINCAFIDCCSPIVWLLSRLTFPFNLPPMGYRIVWLPWGGAS